MSNNPIQEWTKEMAEAWNRTECEWCSGEAGEKAKYNAKK